MTRLASVAVIVALFACQSSAREGVLRLVDGRPVLTPLASREAYAHFLRGELQLHRGDAKGAIRHLHKALEIDPTSPYLHVRLAAALISQRRLAEALAHTDQALQHRPGFAGALLLMAEVERRRGQPARAEAALRACVEQNPRLPEGHLQLAALLEKQGLADPAKIGRARQVLERLTRALPKSVEGRERLALLCLRTLDYGCAARVATRAVALAPTVPSLLRLAHARRGLGQIDSAVRVLREAFDRSGGHAAVAFSLVELLAEKREGAAVDDLVDLLLRQARGDARQVATAAEIALRGKRPAKALALLEAHLRIHEDATLRLPLALAYEEVGRREEAKKVLSELAAERGSPAGPTAAMQLAAILQREGSGAQAVRTLREAQKRHGHHEGLVLELARVLQRQGMEAAAVDVLQRAVAENGGHALELGLALAFEKAGRWRDALAVAERVAGRQPDSAEARNFVGYCLAEHGVQLERAEREIRRALFSTPRAAYIIDSLGWVLHKRGNRAAALHALEIAVQLAPGEPEILGHLAVVRAALRQVPAAIRLLKRALAACEDPAVSARLRAKLERLTRGQVGRSEGKAR